MEFVLKKKKKKLFRDIPEGNEKCGWKIERRARL